MKKSSGNILAIIIGVLAVILVIVLFFEINSVVKTGNSHAEKSARVTANSKMKSVASKKTESVSESSSSFVSSSSLETEMSNQSSSYEESSTVMTSASSEISTETTNSSEVSDVRDAQTTTSATCEYQAPDPVENSQTVYVNASIPGRYHLDPNCRGLQRYGGGTAMTIEEAQNQGYHAECAYERYGN
ncbi:hypothetical protein [Ligilactobacillus apodemi]|uniref:hypothetical protein n=1 Tax=Ligilactobacillus apodemi TaxID=307126 RepID=UPI00214B17EA|nr:hypothetical protein [Ligilactobacillus apodemi]MCR1900667.1 hypothetical protein [Ligilactobacillus apodemi]